MNFLVQLVSLIFLSLSVLNATQLVAKRQFATDLMITTDQNTTLSAGTYVQGLGVIHVSRDVSSSGNGIVPIIINASLWLLNSSSHQMRKKLFRWRDHSTERSTGWIAFALTACAPFGTNIKGDTYVHFHFNRSPSLWRRLRRTKSPGEQALP